MLKQLEKGKIPDQYPHYPVQVWRFGDQLTWVALGGEVVIDYNLRLKKELAGKAPVWITGYANDVMAYIPVRPRAERRRLRGGLVADLLRHADEMGAGDRRPDRRTRCTN